jgi:hypothetical protein
MSQFIRLVFLFGFVNDCWPKDVKAVHGGAQECDGKLTIPMNFFNVLLSLMHKQQILRNFDIVFTFVSQLIIVTIIFRCVLHKRYTINVD